MSARSIRRRVERIEEKASSDNPTEYTLEELCRSLWLDDSGMYRELTERDVQLRSFIPQFEREDAQRLRGVRST